MLGLEQHVPSFPPLKSKKGKAKRMMEKKNKTKNKADNNNSETKIGWRAAPEL